LKGKSSCVSEGGERLGGHDLASIHAPEQPRALLRVYALCATAVGHPVQFVVAGAGYLRTKYSDEQIVQRIMRRSYWNGQSAEQLLDSLGQPSGVNRQLMKTKQREVWKYSPVGKNRYKLRITLDQGQVVGWDANGYA
jgi:hypothetical protein